jgi:hypothetical protein
MKRKKKRKRKKILKNTSERSGITAALPAPGLQMQRRRRGRSFLHEPTRITASTPPGNLKNTQEHFLLSLEFTLSLTSSWSRNRTGRGRTLEEMKSLKVCLGSLSYL